MSEKEPSKQTLWFVMSKEKVVGPFPAGGIRRSLLLGRFALDDQVSTDKLTWEKIYDTPEVIPPEMRRSQEDRDGELLKAKLREDERSGIERRKSNEGRLPQSDRRQAEPPLIERHREAKTRLRHISQRRDIPTAGIVTAAILVLISIGYGLYLGTPELLPEPDCSASPVAGVNWRNCQMDNLVADAADLHGADLGNASLRNSSLSGVRLNNSDIRYADLGGSDLSHAELKDANLQGAGLRNTDLSYTDLSGAVLSYADMTGANLGGSILTGATFDHAIWPDGRKCLVGSVGDCLTSD